MANGYSGQVLRVNLSTRQCDIEPLNVEKARKFLGGAGFGAEVLYNEVKAGVDPLGPDNKIVFATSPVTCNTVAGGGSIMVCFKSPATGAWGESRCGGNFGPDLRRAGFDHIIVEGASDSPLYLAIADGTPRLEDASALVGKDVYEKTDFLEENESFNGKKPSVMCIGQAGEEKVLFAAIMSRDRAAGRNGGGAVMGAKNLLAISVAGGSQPESANKAGFRDASKATMKTVRSNEICGGFNEFGTIGDMPANDEDGDWPSQNWRSNSWGEGARLFDHFQEQNLVSSKRCYTGCPIGCGRVCEVKEGEFKTPVHEGGEYESISVFTSFVLNKNMDAAVHCDYLCNKWGIDSISAGAMIAFAMECYEKGIITSDDVDGLDLTWGNASALPVLLKMMTFREGFGDILANGVRNASETLGEATREFAIHVKGLEGPAHDPRSGKLLGIAYGTGNRGMCHMHPLEGMAFDRGKLDWGMKAHGARDPETIDRWDEEGKGEDCALLQRAMILPDVLCTCKFMSYAGINPEDWALLVAETTGWDMDAAELLQVGERVHNLQRMFNMREGLGREDDMLPKRVLSVPEFGTYKDEEKCVISDYSKLLDSYYAACGWDVATGTPSPEKIAELGLDIY
ncbi:MULTISPECIES: aldehyde ferredoxin oxidoreductase family protein [Desulfosediminicola]|uniref:aldehyde ferredoxin oxidoreductase family protein n=1 Tax=Desulfosediminicola TaxID=2886823 RepID=UPI0010AC6018|nr:aldehyde ferredoxin oxidoreductase family protein [Desulfosediminicola ganghwensis]